MEVGPKEEGVLEILKVKINPVDLRLTVRKIINMLNN